MNTRRLPVNLNDRDVLDRGQKLAQAEHDYAVLEGEKKASADSFKRSMDATKTRIADLSAAIRDRVEIQDVEITVEDDTLKMEHRIIRCDTGEIVETYPFSEKEKQKAMFV